MDATDPTPELKAVGDGAYVVRVLHSPGGPRGRTVVLTDAALPIGREGPDGLVLEDTQASRRHALVEHQQARFVLTDQASRNGVFVNGRRVERHELDDGDVFRIGSHLLLFQFIPRSSLGDRRQPSTLLGAMVASSHKMQALHHRLAAIAELADPVLILGETGVGKELVARGLHALSGREGTFVPVNCGALSRTLGLSELFGSVPGAFTDATLRVGSFQQATKGTLFFDELGELDTDLQKALLRVLQDGIYRRIGDNADQRVTARVIAATNLPLGPAMKDGRFREDLYHRLRAHTVAVPPLRGRRDDIPALVEHLLEETSLRPTINAWEALLAYDWPGNVRELEQVLREAAPLCRNGALDLDDLRSELTAVFAPRRASTSGPPPEAALLDIPRDQRPTADHVRRAMTYYRGNVQAVADFFAKDRKQVHRWLEEYGIERSEYR